MSVESLSRVMRRLREELKVQNIKGLEVSKVHVERCIMKEIGTDYRTVDRNIRNMFKLGWIRNRDRWRYIVEWDEVW